MTQVESLRSEARRWLFIAARDLKAARVLTTEEATSSVFHSHQAAEKVMKGLLTFHAVGFRKTHDLEELAEQCIRVESGLASLLDAAARMPDYAVTFRYLDSPGEPDQVDAEEALGIAQKLYDAVLAVTGS